MDSIERLARLMHQDIDLEVDNLNELASYLVSGLSDVEKLPLCNRLKLDLANKNPDEIANTWNIYASDWVLESDSIIELYQHILQIVCT